MSFTCNNPLCRLTLSSGFGWVTFCSHIFCHGCGTTMEEKGSCTACSMDLRAVGSQPARLGRINLAPSREEKMMALAGLGPKDIMEAASYGLSFYQRQVMGETADQERKIKSLRNRMNQLKSYHEQVVLQFKVKVTKMELELEEARRTGKLQNPSPGCMLEAIKHEQEDPLIDQFTKDAQGDEMMEQFTGEEATTSKFLPRAVMDLNNGGHLEDSFIWENRRKASQSSITAGNYSHRGVIYANLGKGKLIMCHFTI